MDGLRNIYMGLWANHVWNWNWNLIRNAPFTAQSPLLALRSIQLMSGEPGSVLQLLGESAVSLCSQHVRFPKHSIYNILRDLSSAIRTRKSSSKHLKFQKRTWHIQTGRTYAFVYKAIHRHAVNDAWSTCARCTYYQSCKNICLRIL